MTNRPTLTLSESIGRLNGACDVVDTAMSQLADVITTVADGLADATPEQRTAFREPALDVIANTRADLAEQVLAMLKRLPGIDDEHDAASKLRRRAAEAFKPKPR